MPASKLEESLPPDEDLMQLYGTNDKVYGNIFRDNRKATEGHTFMVIVSTILVGYLVCGEALIKCLC